MNNKLKTTETCRNVAGGSCRLNRPLEGIIPPLITPLLDRDRLDVEGLERLIEHVLGGGVNGIFILGTSGEAPSLSYRLRRELIRRTCRLVRERVPVLVGVTDTAFVESVRLAWHAAESGAAAVVLSAPYYFPEGQPELLEYIQRIVPELPLPVFIYNMPAMTKVCFELETLRRAAELEKIIGMKDSSGSLSYFRKVLTLKKERPDWSFFIGPEHLLLGALKAGGDGGVNGIANYHPRLATGLYKAAHEGNWNEAKMLHRQLLRLGKIYRVGRHASSVIKGMKCALSLMGICSDFMAEPFTRFRPPERKRVAAVLEREGLLPESHC